MSVAAHKWDGSNQMAVYRSDFAAAARKKNKAARQRREAEENQRRRKQEHDDKIALAFMEQQKEALQQRLHQHDRHVAEWRFNKQRTFADIRYEMMAICPFSWSEISGNQRTRAIIAWRHALMHRAKKDLPASLPQIGRWCGGFDHTTVLHAVNHVQAAFDAGKCDVLTSPAGMQFYMRFPIGKT